MSEEYRAQQRAEAAARRRAAVQQRGADARQEPPQQRAEQGPTESRGQIGHTSHYVRVGDWRNPALAAGAPAVSDLVGGNPPIAVTGVVAVELAQRYKRMTEDEKTVFDLLRRLAADEIYTVWVNEDDLLGAMDSELDREDRKRLLANMKSRGLLEEGVGKWRAAP